MRLPSDHKFGRLAKACLVLTATTALAACGMTGGSRPASYSAQGAVNGPQADYPVLIGDSYQVDGTTYTPADVRNYDEVGHLAAGTGEGVTGAHHTLPVPSYVEVASLETGRTILVRLEQRGPMASNHLIALSPDAMAQLGGSPDTPVRVRRVNPPEEHRALLRAGSEAPLRMDMPMSLVSVLLRRLPEEGSASLRASNTNTPPEAAEMAENAPDALAPVEQVQQAAPPLAASNSNTPPALAPLDAAPAPTPQPAAVEAVEGGFVVQAAAFSTEERAHRAAEALGGQVTQAGPYFRVRTGPFTTRAQAEASLANVQAAGYTDARILTNG